MLFISLFLGSAAFAQEGMQPANVQTIVMEIVPEPNCPIQVTGARTELGFDSFGLPVFGKTYIDYKNASEKTINAVKFRVRYLDKDGNSRGTFHANDEAFVPQGAQATGKFAHYKLRANIQQGKIRVLAIKFADGTTWESERMKEILRAQQEGRDGDADDDNQPMQSQSPLQQQAPPAIQPVSPPAKVESSPFSEGVPASPPAKVETPPAKVETPPEVPASPSAKVETPPETPAAPAKVEAPPEAPSQAAPKGYLQPMVEEEALTATPQSLKGTK